MKLIVRVGVGVERVRGGTLHAGGQRRPSRDQDHEMLLTGVAANCFLSEAFLPAGLSAGAKKRFNASRIAEIYRARFARAIKASYKRLNIEESRE